MSSINILAWITKSVPYLLNIGIIAGYMILIVMLIRLFFKKAPKNCICGMWGIVALRLVVPMSMFQSWFSFVPSAKTIQTETLSYQGSALQAPAIVDIVKNPIYPESLTLKLPVTVDLLIEGLSVFSLIWVAGVISMLLYVVISTQLLKRKLKTAILLEPGIKQTEMIDTPFVLGILRPTIYLPYSIKENDMEYVVAHEKAHIRRSDHIWKLLGFIVLSVYWFNSLFWGAYTLLCRDIEIACDEAVIRDLNNEERRMYATALLNCSVKHPVISVCPLAFGEVSGKNRIKYIMSYKRVSVREIIIAAAFCVILAVGFIAEPKAVPKSPSVDYYLDPSYYSVQAPANTYAGNLHGGFPFPCDSRVVEEVYGLRVGNDTYRTQLNFIGNRGDSVYAVARGRITFAGYDRECGNKISIQSQGYNVYNLITVYFYLDDIYVKEGDYVNPGDIIGTIGKSGPTISPKLGFRVIKDYYSLIDPMTIFRNKMDELTIHDKYVYVSTSPEW